MPTSNPLIKQPIVLFLRGEKGLNILHNSGFSTFLSRNSPQRILNFQEFYLRELN